MPEEQSTETSLEGVLDQLEEYTLNVHNYQTVQDALDADNAVKAPTLEKLLTLCVRSLKEDMKYTVKTLNIIFSVLQKVKSGECLMVPDLVPSAVAVLHILKTTALFNKVEALKILCFEIVLLYPDETLISLAVDHNMELMELFNLYCHQRIPTEIRLQPLNIIAKLLKILPPDKKSMFVKEGVSIWFSKIVPTVVLHTNNQNLKADVPVEVLEMLTEELVKIDYHDNPQWHIVYECIYTPERYPAIMKNLLENNNDLWYRLWIIFIKLLKNQITKVTNSVGSPINSLLPVVETAFKMDYSSRCRAFLCWNVLIDNFSLESNEVYINKRLKLLVVPLIANNAKVEETALAKLNSWWHLIVKFHSKIDKISDVILVPFLQFCFGKPIFDRPVLIPGMISDELKRKCVDAFLEILGHCGDCDHLPKLDEKIIKTKHIVNHWKELYHSLTCMIKISTRLNTDISKSQIRCAWISFLITLGEMPESKVKRDLYFEVLYFLNKLAMGCEEELGNNIINILIPALFVDNENITSLIHTCDERKSLERIMELILSLPKNCLKVREETIKNIRPITNYYVKEKTQSIYSVDEVLKGLSPEDLLLWTALAESICELKYHFCPQMLFKMLNWPLNHINLFTNVKESTSSWLDMYSFVYSKCTDINDTVITILQACNDNNQSTNDFVLSASIAMLEQKINHSEDPEFNKEVELLLKACDEKKFSRSMNPEENMQKILKVINSALSMLIKNNNVITAENTINIIKNTLKIIRQVFNESSINETNVLKLMEDLLISLESTSKLEEYSDLKFLIIDELLECSPVLKKRKSLKDTIVSIYKNILDINENDTLTKNVKRLVKVFEINSELNKSTLDKVAQSLQNQGPFSSPNTKTLPKKTKKKEASIVNTVVENGEEFVVVKSNWKFNPRKLTDNQKEKFQRKREDIPALYQDLSQSQDEFKLTAWKTDSQDASSTSKSTSASMNANEDVSSILKHIPNSEIVPKILENFRPCNENIENNSKKTEQKSENDKASEKFVISDVKETKSPRMALKDRVFRNVRNLIEKSSLPNQSKDLSCSITEDFPKTPTSNKVLDSINLINSAPPKISSDRPSRVKRKPKKFDDLTVFSLKKRRHSAGQNDSTTDSIDSEDKDDCVVIINDNEIEKDNKLQSDSVECTGKQNDTYISEIQAKDERFDENPIDVNNKLEKQEDKTTFQGIINAQCTVNIELDESSNFKDVMNNDIKTNEVSLVENDKPLDVFVSTEYKPELITPKAKNKNIESRKSSIKKSSTKKSRIEKELAIDMVEGHPYLKSQPERRLTRKTIENSPFTRKSMSVKSNNKIKTLKSSKKCKEKDKPVNKENASKSNDDILASQDVIESSQDSSITTISVMSTKSVNKMSPMVSLVKLNTEILNDTQNLLEEAIDDKNLTSKDSHSDIKDDTELPSNKTIDNNTDLIVLTENMDTEPVQNSERSDDVMVLNDNYVQSIVINSQDTFVEPGTQNTANTDTQSMDPTTFIDTNHDENPITVDSVNVNIQNESFDNDVTYASLATPDDVTETLENIHENNDETSSPLKDKVQRKKDFLNNTLEISPIKTLSPVLEKKSPSPETSSDYVVIKLSSPVQSNGEPFEKCDSPEVFTEDKLSPDKINNSPPREEVVVTNTSPSSSLSLKKNRPQVRSGGRAAQMLGLCVPDRLQTIMMDKHSEIEETKKNTPISTSARRNLRILYNTTGENDISDEHNESENFLKFKRLLPTTDSSPSGPILKRKLADIADDTTFSPASKRKRVSFHDPPVSTTICVKKYIEPGSLRSPQNSAMKRQERQLRAQVAVKSPKRLDTLFKLDSVLTKTIESFDDANTPLSNEDTEMSSLDQTPVVEVVKTTDLNDTDPICSELIDCEHSIKNIAAELSSPTMKTLLVQEFEGQLNTIGDLAKMTELQINRLCIKAPKVQVAKKVLSEYAVKLQQANAEITPTVEAAMLETIVPDFKVTIGVQTNEMCCENIETQTVTPKVVLVTTQTDAVVTAHCSVQTDESGCKFTADIIKSCLLERTDFLDNLNEHMDEGSKQRIADDLPFNMVTDVLINKLSPSNSSLAFYRIMDQQMSFGSNNKEDRRLLLLKDYLCDRFDTRDMVLFCSDILKKAYEKSS